MLDVLLELINKDQNSEILKMPDEEEVKLAVMGLNGCSVGGLDGMTSLFF